MDNILELLELFHKKEFEELTESEKKDIYLNVTTFRNRIRIFKTVSGFIRYTKLNPDNFRSYCEIVIDEKGRIYLPLSTGHMYIVEYITRCKCIPLNNLSSDTLSWYNEWLLYISKCCMVWYDFQKMDKNQLNNENIINALNRLNEVGLIKKNLQLVDYKHVMKTIEEI